MISANLVLCQLVLCLELNQVLLRELIHKQVAERSCFSGMCSRIAKCYFLIITPLIQTGRNIIDIYNCCIVFFFSSTWAKKVTLIENSLFGSFKWSKTCIKVTNVWPNRPQFNLFTKKRWRLATVEFMQTLRCIDDVFSKFCGRQKNITFVLLAYINRQIW